MAKGDGWVYVAVTESQPGWVKVGSTYRTPEERAKELSSETTAPTPYFMVYAALVSDYKRTEKIIHKKLKAEGLHGGKEYFKCDPWIAIECIRENVDVKYEDCDEEYDKDYGEGTINYEGGDIYVGEYKISADGLKYRHGQGTYTWSDGRKHVGQWKNDDAHGQGTFTSPDGSNKTGKWQNDEFTGRGVSVFSDGTKYIGEWKDGKITGQGTYTWSDGRKYVGSFKGLSKHGFGSLSKPDGTTFVGNFCDGVFHGKIKKTDSAGNVTEHLYKNGRFVKTYGLRGFLERLHEEQPDPYYGIENQHKTGEWWGKDVLRIVLFGAGFWVLMQFLGSL
jgi:hypothetical protein